MSKENYETKKELYYYFFLYYHVFKFRPAQGGTITEPVSQKYTSFTIGSIVVMIVGLDKIVTELKAAVPKPYLLTDLLWLLGKSLKSKNSRDVIIQAFTLPGLVQELFNYITYYSLSLA